MATNNLRKLNRRQLLELMLEQSKRIDELEQELADVKNELEVRYIIKEQSGSIAEAALRLNKVFEAAQDAYYNNKILVKRVIGRAGEWVDMDEDGTVYVNSRKLEEPYLVDKAYGTCDLDFPYQVPEGRIFVMGDNRSVSLDSRCTVVGCVSEELIVGKLFLSSGRSACSDVSRRKGRTAFERNDRKKK